MANPNPVAAGERPGATNIRWSVGDGSQVRVHMVSGMVRTRAATRSIAMKLGVASGLLKRKAPNI
jgi:hypothetical protein